VREQRERNVFGREWGGKRLSALTGERGPHERLTTLAREAGERLPTRPARLRIERLKLRLPRRTWVRRKTIDLPGPVAVRRLSVGLITVQPALEVTDRSPDAIGSELGRENGVAQRRQHGVVRLVDR
jgi:hypothetical protein